MHPHFFCTIPPRYLLEIYIAQKAAISIIGFDSEADRPGEFAEDTINHAHYDYTTRLLYVNKLHIG